MVVIGAGQKGIGALCVCVEGGVGRERALPSGVVIGNLNFLDFLGLS